MANYQYQKFYSSWFLMIICIIFTQNSILVIAQSNQYVSPNTSNFRSILATTISTVLYNNMDDSVYDSEAENIDGDDIYDEEGDYSLSTTVTDSEFNNITSHLSDGTAIKDYADETGSYQENDDLDDDNNHIYADTMSVDRSNLNRPTLVSDNTKPLESSSTSRIPFAASNLWRDLFSKPMILVGIIGGIVIGMLSAILLLMFIIYRMRKKDEGSYVLEESPGKSPSHAYTRVSSREFFA